MLNEILGVASRFNAALTRKFGITGGAPSPQLTPEVVPTYELMTADEDRVLANEHFAAGWITCAAVVAKTPKVRLRNPVGSQLVAVVTFLSVDVAAAGVAQTVKVQLNYATTDLAVLPAVPGPCFLDSRSGVTLGLPSPTVKLTADSNGIVGSGGYNRMVRLSNFEARGVIAILGPGSAIDIEETDNNNLAMTVNLEWREIPLGLAELGPF